MSEWINHVKNYQAEHGCSYKEALKCASCSYKKGSSMEGGKFNLKNAVNKGAKGVKKAGKVLKKNEKLIKFAVGDEYADTVDKAIKVSNRASKIADEVETQTGAGVNHLGRKLKHSVAKGRKIAKKVSKNIDKYGVPVLEMVAPELAPEIIAANEAIKRINGGALGSTRKGKVNPYLNGGSFSVPKASHGGSFAVPIRGGCMTCNKPTNSSLISPHHQAFHPKKPKSYAELITNN